MRPFTLQKAANRKPKGRLLHAKRRPFTNPLIINKLRKER